MLPTHPAVDVFCFAYVWQQIESLRVHLKNFASSLPERGVISHQSAAIWAVANAGVSAGNHLLVGDWNVVQCVRRTVTGSAGRVKWPSSLSPIPAPQPTFGVALDQRDGTQPPFLPLPPCLWGHEPNCHNGKIQGPLILDNLPFVWVSFGPSINSEAAGESEWKNPC